MAGLVPAISLRWAPDWSSTTNVRIEIAPCRVLLGDKPSFVSPRPMFHVLFALNGFVRGRVLLEIDELINAIASGVPADEPLFMLVYAANEIVGNANIDGASRSTGENINVVLAHAQSM